jgi:hypothetical protein
LPDRLRLSSELFPKGKGVTVRQKLLELGAYYKAAAIYDREGNPILFRRIECEGPPPREGVNDPGHWAERQHRELKELRQQYTVVTFCRYKP